MKILEITRSFFGVMTLNEDDHFIVEMANFLADVTDLPANIVLWAKTQPEMLPHDKYRMKVYKDRIHVATYSISKNPQLLWQSNRKKYNLDKSEESETISVISDYSSIFIQLVDGTISNNDAKYEIKKQRGAK